MEKLWTILKIMLPILAAVWVGTLARRRRLLTPEGVEGLQQFAIRIALPCTLFNSCLASSFGAETLTSMVLLWPLMFLSALWSFRARRGRRFPYGNLPMCFAAKESGMMGVPLYLMLFGASQVYRMAALDVAQAMIAVPTIALLSAGETEKLPIREILRRIITSPYLIAALLGIAVNLSGVKAWLDSVGAGAVLTETVSFLGTPISAVILVTIGYNFSLSRQNLRQAAALTAVHFAVFAVICGVIQACLCLLPQVPLETRLAVLLYCMLPVSFLAPGLGRRREECAVVSCACSLSTLVTLAVFCAMVVALA